MRLLTCFHCRNATICTLHTFKLLLQINHKVVDFQPASGYIHTMIKRNITNRILQALSDTRVVFLNGARQTGKSTLCRNLAQTDFPAQYVSLDELTVLDAAQSDAVGFIQNIKTPIIIDEVQKVPNLFLAIKEIVDKCPDPGQFLLTGSANVLLLPHISESLAGRMEIITLWPFSQGELEGVKDTFIDWAFANESPVLEAVDFDLKDIIGRITRGGYPEVVNRRQVSRRKTWFDSYVTTILQRDVRDIANIEGLVTLPRLLQVLATRTTGILNYSELSRTMAIPQSTLKRYLALLEMTFLLQKLQPWAGNPGKRLVKAPKIFLNDSGLLNYFVGVEEKQLLQKLNYFGALLENLVFSELTKQLTWNETQARLYYYRTQTGQEVDFLLENMRGEIIGIEVKAAASVQNSDFNGLRSLASTLGKRFLRGFVLHPGKSIVPFAENMFSAPVSILWKNFLTHQQQ